MPPKKNIKKVKVITSKPKAKPKAKAKAKATIDNRKITDKRQTQSVNVNVSVGKESERSSKVRDDSKSQSQMKGAKIPTRITAPTIIPQYIQGNPPPMPPTPPPIMMTQQIPPITIPKVKPTPPIMTSLGSLDDMSETNSLRSYDVSEPLSELTSESYKYSVSDVPSGINLESVKSTSPPSAIDFLRDLKKKVLEPREPFREIIQGDGSIQVLTEEQEPLTLEMSKSDKPALSGLSDEEFEQLSIAERVKVVNEEIKKKRGKPPGTKNRPKEEIEADKEEKLEKKKAREEKMKKKMEEEQRKAEIRERRAEGYANRQDEIDRRLEEGNRFDIVEQRVTQRLLQQKIKNL